VVSSGGLCLWAFDIEIDHDGILTTSYDDSFTGFVGEGVDLLVRHVWRNIDEIAGAGFTAEFQVVAPSHAGPAANDIEDGFQVAVVVRAGLGVGLDYNCAGPQSAGSRSGVSDGGGPGHTGSLGSVWVQVAGWNDFDAVVLPVHDLHDIGLSPRPRQTTPNSSSFGSLRKNALRQHRHQHAVLAALLDAAASAGEPRLSVLLGSLADDPRLRSNARDSKGQVRRVGIGQVGRRLDFIAELFQIAR
jgi:hypothetical protein